MAAAAASRFGMSAANGVILRQTGSSTNVLPLNRLGGSERHLGQFILGAPGGESDAGDLVNPRRWFPIHARRPVLALPEYIMPVLEAGGPVALLFVALRCGPDAVVRLLAGSVAVLTGDEKRSERCLKVLRILRGKAEEDDDPPSSTPALP